MKSPVLFIIFRRYDTALQVFDCIREARPPKLYVAADAPRDGNVQEIADCAKTREIVNLVDWNCEVKTLFQTENQGCGLGPSKAISWFFENEEQGIILEDDCVPHLDFFRYCDEMLDKYANDTNISLITSRCVMPKVPSSEDSYFLSALHFCWGWASWRRVWKNYNYELKGLSLRTYLFHLYQYYGCAPGIIMWRANIFMNSKMGKVNPTWDYQFVIITQLRDTYTIIPKVNMVTNIGFDERATHTASSNYIDLQSHGLYPIKHPKKLTFDPSFDIEYAKCRYNRWKLPFQFIRTLFNYTIFRK